MIENKIQNIIKKGETETVEFKSSFGKPIIETLVAFSNYKGGSIYLGVSNNGEIIGIQLYNETV